MSFDHQIEIPPSFVALYMRPGRSTPVASHAEVLARYEQCEDMALVLMEQAHVLAFKESLSEQEVLTRCRQGLLFEEPVGGKPGEPPPDAPGDRSDEQQIFSTQEAEWVVRRLAELLEWTPLESLSHQ